MSQSCMSVTLKGGTENLKDPTDVVGFPEDMFIKNKQLKNKAIYV